MKRCATNALKGFMQDFISDFREDIIAGFL